MLLVDKNRGGDARQDQTVEQRERERLVLARNNGGKERTNRCETNNADLADLQSSQARRCILGEGEQKRHSERYETGQ